MDNSKNDGGERCTGRVVITVLLVVTTIYVLVFNGLAGPGLPPFTNPTGNVSDIFYTCITPAGYTFSIWGVIYACLVLIVIYAIVLLFVHVDEVLACNLGGPVSVPFMLTFIVNMNLNLGWLFAWDSLNATASAILLLLVALTNVIAISLALYYFKNNAKEIYDKSRLHFWLGILVINGYGIYDAWTTIAALINLTVFLRYQIELVLDEICIGMLIFLLVAFIAWFIVENTILATLVNPLITHYIVYVWAAGGVYAEQKDIASETVVSLILANLGVGVCLLVARVASIAYRNRHNRIYSYTQFQVSPSSAELDL